MTVLEEFISIFGTPDAHIRRGRDAEFRWRKGAGHKFVKLSFHRMMPEESDIHDGGKPTEACERDHGKGRTVELGAHESDDQGTKLAAEIADGVDHGDAGGGGRAG